MDGKNYKETKLKRMELEQKKKSKESLKNLMENAFKKQAYKIEDPLERLDFELES